MDAAHDVSFSGPRHRRSPDRMRLLPAAVVLTLTWLTSATVRADATLDALVATALAQNPQLDALQAQLRALDAQTRQAGAWQNPKLQLAYQNAPIDSFALGREPMTAVVLGLEQTVPWFGKTSRRERVVRETSRAKRFELQETRNELSALVKTAYYRLTLARQLRKLTEEHIALVEELYSAVRAKYEVGRTEQQNVLRLEVLKQRLDDDLDDFSRQDSQLTAAINATLARPSSTPIETPEELSLPSPTYTLAELQKRARQQRPVLKQLQATARMYRTAADVSEDEAVPDPTFFAAYSLRTALPNGNPGRDLVTLGVRVPLPVFYGSTFGAHAAQAREQASAIDARRDAVITTLDGDLGDAFAAWSRASRKRQTYRDRLLPAARRTLDATLTNYQVDRADFVSLYEAELDLLGFDKTLRTAVVEGLLARTTVEKLVGGSLP